MIPASTRCLIFQRDGSVLVNMASPGFGQARDALRRFAELQQCLEGFERYRITQTALWGAAAGGLDALSVLRVLETFGETPPPATLTAMIHESMARYGLLRLEGAVQSLRLCADDPGLLRRLNADLGLAWSDEGLVVPAERRGWVKSALIEMGFPVIDEAALISTRPVAYGLRPEVVLRPYQERAVERALAQSGGAVVLLPCGAGKTVVGVAMAARLQARTLVVSPSRTIGEQWRQHFLAMTTLSPDQVRLYDRASEPGVVTIATYQAMTHRARGQATALDDLFDRPWGLVVFDEVHSLPADVFRRSAMVQATRRLGLTATLVREDGRERDVFALVGPPVYSAPWRTLEREGWIAGVRCVEVRVRASTQPVTDDRLLAAKIRAVRVLVARHAEEPTLVVAQRLGEVAAVAHALGVPSITGQTPEAERRRLYASFRAGEIRCLALSRVANAGVDLPDASVLIQLSGVYGSRQEEAQRVGRLLRPKGNGRPATFYTLVAVGTRETTDALRRRRFLVDQGYRYEVVSGDSLAPAG